jgi:hypothetical protein
MDNVFYYYNNFMLLEHLFVTFWVLSYFIYLFYTIRFTGNTSSGLRTECVDMGRMMLDPQLGSGARNREPETENLPRAPSCNGVNVPSEAARPTKTFEATFSRELNSLVNESRPGAGPCP